MMPNAPTHFEFHGPGSTGGASTWLGFVIGYYVVLFLVLYRILTRRDFDTLNKILWVMVVVMVPCLGLVLYWVAAPAPAGSSPQIVPGSDVSGTPWAGKPGYTKRS